MVCDIREAVAAFSGVASAVALSAVADCWLGHPPRIAAVLPAVLSLSGAVLLNTVDWEVLTSTDEMLRKRVAVLLMLSYGTIFFQFGVVVWRTVQAPWTDGCSTECCVDTEGYYVLLILLACSAFRFSPLISSERRNESGPYSEFGWGSYGSSGSYNRLGTTDSCIIPAAVTAAALMVSAVLLQTFATVGRYGTGAAALVPVPYMVGAPIMLTVRAIAALESGQLWRSWNRCISMTVQGFCTTWPLALYHRDFINFRQCALGLSANLCLMAAVQLLATVTEIGAGRLSSATTGFQL